MILLYSICQSFFHSAKPSDFEFLRVIGKGSFGKVLLARHKVELRHYAVKVLSKRLVMNRNEAKHIMSERNVLLKNLNHPFLVGLHYSFQTPDKLYFVLDYINGGEVNLLVYSILLSLSLYGENRSAACRRTLSSMDGTVVSDKHMFLNFMYC